MADAGGRATDGDARGSGTPVKQARPINALGRQARCISAPGKMMIAGEYAVLEGAEALVAAVDRRAYLWMEEQEGPRVPPEARAARAAAEARLSPVAGGIHLDVGGLRSDGKKLGLGSSAAAAAAAAGYVFDAAGHDLQTSETRRAVLDAAFEGHRAVAPRGSGADVAASVMGGLVRFRRDGERALAEPIAWPAALEAVVVWTETEVRTSDMLDAVDRLRRGQPDTYRSCYQRLFEAAGWLVEDFASGDTRSVLRGVNAYADAMRELGDAAGVSIVTDTLAAIQRLAMDHSGAAKPSGAGGGDVAIAVFEDGTCRDQFVSACGERGLTVLSLVLGTCGLRVEAPRSPDV